MIDGITLLALDRGAASLVWIVLVLGIPLGWLWATQFIQLMLMSDNDFPGRRDKLVWGIAFIVVFAFTPFAFWGWKSAYVDLLEKEARNGNERKKEHREKNREPRTVG